MNANLWFSYDRVLRVGPPGPALFYYLRPDGSLPDTSVLILKFASTCGSLSCELQNLKDTSNLMILVWFWI